MIIYFSLKLSLYNKLLLPCFMRKIFAIMTALIAGGLAIVSSTLPQAANAALTQN